MLRIAFLVLFSFLMSSVFAGGYWQQRAEYKMEVSVDSNRMIGSQNLVYYNNSPDTLYKVYYHLYYNAFQPGSMMDVRSRTISDPDSRVKDRIAKLKPEEEGWHKILSLKCDRKKVEYSVDGTILEVRLKKAVLPGAKVVFDMEFQSQIPVQIRRTGKDNAEGIDYSMCQWYPKMVEYDTDGWHTNPYIGREFYGVWGSFDVKISIDSAYVIGGTGYLQNPYEIGHGYAKDPSAVKRPKGERLEWHFVADSVHDFAWAADPDYRHDIVTLDDGVDVHFFYQTDTLASNWESLQEDAVKMFDVLNEKFGEYPYGQFSFLQAGDGGMEYPMSTFVVGHRKYGGFRSTCIHELIHNWYYGVLASNEAKYAWMDEGFTIFAQHYVLNEFEKEKKDFFMGRAERVYKHIVAEDDEEPLCTHADHYHANLGYAAVYFKGGVFLQQLKNILGDSVFYKGMKEYYEEWKFRHPRPDDFKRSMEQVSGCELDWYFEGWVHTTKTIDYGVRWVSGKGDSSVVGLERVGQMPMPVEVEVVLRSGSALYYYIPLRVMRFEKESDAVLLDDWPWTYTHYSFTVPVAVEEIKEVRVDPFDGHADVDEMNDVFPPDVPVFEGEEAEE